MPCSDPDLPRCFHGTHVAGIAAGKGPDFSGVARDAELVSIQVFSKYGPDECSDEEEEEESEGPCIRASDGDIISGLERVLELSDRFDIAAVNMSLGAGEFPDECDISNPSPKAVADRLGAVGIAAVAASGNKEFTTAIGSPACISSVVSVGSTDDGSTGSDGTETTRDEVSDFSNSSPELDLLAPGRWIRSSVPGYGSGRAGGTSGAAPHVAGAWAVLKSKAPNASVEQVLSALKSTGMSITDSRNNITRPRIQVDAALSALESQPRYTYTSGTSLTLTATSQFGFSVQELAGMRFRVRQPLHRSGERRRKRDRPLRIGCRTRAAPASLSAHCHSPRDRYRIRLNWRDDNGEECEWVFKSKDRNQGGDWRVHWWGLERSRREFVDGSVEPDRSYSYRMYAYDQDGNASGWSSTVTATTLPVPAGDGLTPLTSRRWVIPTTANVSGRFGGIFKTNLTLANLSEEDIEVTAKLYGARGLVQEETISLEAVTYSLLEQFSGFPLRLPGGGGGRVHGREALSGRFGRGLHRYFQRQEHYRCSQPAHAAASLYRIGHKLGCQRERRQADQHRGVQQFEPKTRR